MNRAVLIAAAMMTCCGAPDVNPNRPGGPVDCEKACENMRDAGCEEGQPSPERGVPCEKWCLNYHYPRGDKGYMPPWAGCVAAAGPDPKIIESCNMSCTRGNHAEGN